MGPYVNERFERGARKMKAFGHRKCPKFAWTQHEGCRSSSAPIALQGVSASYPCLMSAGVALGKFKVTAHHNASLF